MSHSMRRSLTRTELAKIYATALAAGIVLDLAWFAVMTKRLYVRYMSDLLRADVQWKPAFAFYLIYAGAMVAFVVLPAMRRRSLRWALERGAFLGVAAYSCFDLVGLAMLKDFPMRVALVDMVWGGVLTAAACGAAFVYARRTITE